MTKVKKPFKIDSRTHSFYADNQLFTHARDEGAKNQHKQENHYDESHIWNIESLKSRTKNKAFTKAM